MAGAVNGSTHERIRVWQGQTPQGHPVVIELDARKRWFVTVAGAIRTSNDSLEAALIEAGGVTSQWATELAARILRTLASASTRRATRSQES